MFFSKYPHPANFAFGKSFDAATKELKIGDEAITLETTDYQEGIARLRFSSARRWNGHEPLFEPIEPHESQSTRLHITNQGHIQFLDTQGKPILETVPGSSFGVSGESWILQLSVSQQARFFGMGEKNFGRMELSGIRTRFWNTDVWSDFHFAQWMEHPTDPPYLSVPYLIVRDHDRYMGILLRTSHSAFMETPGIDEARAFVEWQRTSRNLLVGSEGGTPEIWLIDGPDLRSLTRKLQKLVGVTPLPPIWSLGYHQSRWGYAGEKDLQTLHERFQREQIPCDGLWLDIDYMRGYRVFTVEEDHFPKGTEGFFGQLMLGNRRVVAILDPGVKFERGFDVYDTGHKAGHFCLNPNGKEFVGLVWPGETVFPDFHKKPVRDWWARHVSRLRNMGFSAFWIDMNDPSTGPVDPTSMLFYDGAEPHSAHRNEYALGMQMATFQGMREFNGDERPFLLSRSGSTGTSRYAAVWTGDNISNYKYLRLSIPTSVNLSLSGIPFNGPDIGGFGGDSEEPLMLDWMRACFLFPFTRNHTGLGTRFQEPWAYSPEALKVLGKFIWLRYALLPTLYGLFCDQEEFGDPILRPMSYEFQGDFDKIDDQFMVGPSILQAPIVKAKSKGRTYLLPGTEPWFDANCGTWINPGKRKWRAVYGQTPLFVRNGSILATSPALCHDQPVNLRSVEFHLFAAPGSSGSTNYTYRADDGLSYGYLRGERTILEIHAEWDHKAVEFFVRTVDDGFGEIAYTVVLHGASRTLQINGQDAPLNPGSVVLTGDAMSTLTTQGGLGRMEWSASARTKKND